MKRTLLILILSLSINVLFAQTNFKRIAIGGGLGTAVAYADLEKKTFTFVGYGTLDYYITPYVTIGLEVQKGELAGGDIEFDKNNRQFINSYLSTTANIKFALGELLTSYQLNNEVLYNLRGLYAGVGFGYLNNKISNVRYYGDNFYQGTDKSTEPLIPINLGINFFLPDQWGYNTYIINVNMQTALSRGEGMDGYASPYSKSNDIYTFFSVGFKYNFGPLGLDRRR